MGMAYIRTAYQVPAKRGVRIQFEGRAGTIVGAEGAYLLIRLDGEKKVGKYHPTWNISYEKK